MSTSPTFMSWRRNSSFRSTSSAKPASGEDLQGNRNRAKRAHADCVERSCSDPPQAEPIKLVRPHRQQVRQISDAWKDILAEHLDQNISLVALEIEFHRLRSARKIVHDQNGFFFELPHVRKHPMVCGIEKF